MCPGDGAPLTTRLRILAPLQALVGFANFTAAISWLFSIYPALARRRHLAREISLLERHADRIGRPITTARARFIHLDDARKDLPLVLSP